MREFHRYAATHIDENGFSLNNALLASTEEHKYGDIIEDCNGLKFRIEYEL